MNNLKDFHAGLGKRKTSIANVFLKDGSGIITVNGKTFENFFSAVGEERETIEDVIEPFLIQQGYLQRTPRGRIATPAAFRHLGLNAPKELGDLFSPMEDQG